MLESFTSSTFSEHLNEKFRVQLDAPNALEVELIQVTDAASSPPQERFSVLFRGPGNALLTQRTYRVEHDEIGAFELFLVPVGQDNDGLYYEAVFNRLRK